MKYFLPLLLIILKTGLFAQDTASYEVDFKDPKSVVNAIFYAAKEKDMNVLAGLCDPQKECDGDTRAICMMPEGISQGYQMGKVDEVNEAISYFKETFSEGKITGEITYLEEDGIQYAEIPIWIYNENPDRCNEVMRLVKRYGNWYLSSF